MSEKKDPISLIFLAFNEASTIEEEILSYHDKIISKLPGSEFIVAEDGSTDGTTEIIKKLVKEKGIVHLTSEERKGYKKALIDSVTFAKHNLVFLSDTGLKHDPEDFWDIYPLRNECDMIVGKKTNRQDQFYRKLFTFGYNFVIRKYFGVKNVFDCDSGFRLFNKKVVNQVYNSNKLFFKELPSSEITLRTIFSGLIYNEVPVAYFQREGESRGLPTNKLPRVILDSLKNLKKLKREFKTESNKK